MQVETWNPVGLCASDDEAMPAEVTVGPPVLRINQGDTFMITDLNGEIGADSRLGLFARDTRFLSYYAIFANGEPWTKLSSAVTSYYAARICMVNGRLYTEDGDIEPGTLSLTISREVGEGICENLDISNYSQRKVRFNLEIALRSDFADIFEVRDYRFVRRGHIDTVWQPESSQVRIIYRNKDFKRTLVYRMLTCGSPAHYANGRVVYELELEPGASWYLASRFELLFGDEQDFSDYQIGDATELDSLQAAWKERATKVTSLNEDIYRLFTQSVEDTGALRLHSQNLNPDSWIPAAGVPWYCTIFGRDSLIASLQNMTVNPRFGLGTLQKLSSMQATEFDDYRDAQPGKIMHEVRNGELAHFKRIPHTPYYGTADATALFLITLHEVWKWLGDISLIRKYRDNALRCLEWIDKYGDLDADGFQEYKTYSTQGYENMGWKDSPEAVIYPDGSLVKQPKALCELQGYTFDAWMRMSEAFAAIGDAALSSQLLQKAVRLQKLFEEFFWCDDLDCYAMALDADKRQVKTVSSNAGHCLWSGIAGEEHAQRLARRLFQSDMWTGWGIRTLSSQNPAFNPHSYHNGSIWPHDNGIIAMGLKRYGFASEAAKIARNISEAASYFSGSRLPELYAGTFRSPGSFPVPYLGANVPQAWAAGSAFHLLQAILGLQCEAPNNCLYVDPQLPQWLPEITLHGLSVGSSVVTIRFWREKDTSKWDATLRVGNINIQTKPWRPWLSGDTGSKPLSA